MAELVGKQQRAQSPAQHTGAQSAKRAERNVARSTIFFHALAFVVGFGIIFTLSGAAFGLIGRSFNQYMPMIARFGAVLLFIFGLTTLGVFRWLARVLSENTDLQNNPAAAALVSVCNFFNTLLYTEKRVTEMHSVNRGWGYLSSTLMGVSFSAGWVPCIGPILTSILILAGDSATVGRGAALLAVYSLGLGIPFLITGLAFGTVSGLLRKLNRYMGIVSLVSGAFLLIVAYFLWSDSLGSIAGQFAILAEWVALLEIQFSESIGVATVFDLNLVSAAALSLIAGIISFISPCVLPLVPAYIGYLSGVSLGGANS